MNNDDLLVNASTAWVSPDSMALPSNAWQTPPPAANHAYAADRADRAIKADRADSATHANHADSANKAQVAVSIANHAAYVKLQGIRDALIALGIKLPDDSVGKALSAIILDTVNVLRTLVL